VKKEEDIGFHIKEEDQCDGDTKRERGERKGGRRTDRDDHSMDNGSREVRTAQRHHTDLHRYIYIYKYICIYLYIHIYIHICIYVYRTVSEN